MKYLILLITFSTQIVFGQNDAPVLRVEYSYVLQMMGPSSRYEISSLLTATQNASLYEMDHTNSFDDPADNDTSGGNMVFGIKAKENKFVYKDLDNKTMYYSDMVNMKRFDIHGQIDSIMSWTLGTETKEILGYNCQKAATSYGGRYYVAYFTQDIPLSNGPWRFHNLPGVILSVESTDGVFKIEAQELALNYENPEDMQNPFQDIKTITWEEFLVIYKKKYDEVLRNGMREWGPSQELTKMGIVEYIKN